MVLVYAVCTTTMQGCCGRFPEGGNTVFKVKLHPKMLPQCHPRWTVHEFLSSTEHKCRFIQSVHKMQVNGDQIFEAP